MEIEKEHLNTGIRIEYSLSGKENNDTLVFVHGLVVNMRQFELRERLFARISACFWHPCAVTAATYLQAHGVAISGW
jgi:hypothetical protein